MAIDLKSETEALNTALKNEIDSYDFYKNVEEKASDPLTKKTFHFLAEQELGHMDKIKKYGLIKDVDSEFSTEKVRENVKTLFDKNIKEFSKKLKSDLGPYKAALDIETTGFTYYKQASESTNNPKLKKFFIFLMKEEQIHYTLIENSMKYIQSPEDFFAQEEDWFFEG